jgi:hypothetical protein
VSYSEDVLLGYAYQNAGHCTEEINTALTATNSSFARTNPFAKGAFVVMLASFQIVITPSQFAKHSFAYISHAFGMVLEI